MNGCPLDSARSVNEVGMGAGHAVFGSSNEPSQESTGCPIVDSSTWVRQ